MSVGFATRGTIFAATTGGRGAYSHALGKTLAGRSLERFSGRGTAQRHGVDEQEHGDGSDDEGEPSSQGSLRKPLCDQRPTQRTDGGRPGEGGRDRPFRRGARRKMAGERGHAGERDDDQRGRDRSPERHPEPEREHGDDHEPIADSEEPGESIDPEARREQAPRGDGILARPPRSAPGAPRALDPTVGGRRAARPAGGEQPRPDG